MLWKCVFVKMLTTKYLGLLHFHNKITFNIYCEDVFRIIDFLVNKEMCLVLLIF